MNRTSVLSSNIKSIGFEIASNVLEIEFHSGGIYQYRNVPQNIYDSFLRSASKGSFFDQYIKDKYPTKKIR